MTSTKTSAAAPKSGSGIGGAIGGAAVGIVQEQLNNPEVQKAVLSWLVGLIGGLFKKKPKVAPPVEEIKKPTPADPEEGDDHIPAPANTAEREVSTVRLKLSRAQYQRARFPEQYTEQNPMGLYSSEELRAIEAGKSALNYGSKFWLDLTAFDAAGKEIRSDAVIALGLQYRTEHHCGGAFIKGAGGAPQNPNSYETNDTNEIGNGITAWISSLGFLHQMKAHGEGEFPCSGSVDGVSSNTFTIRVS